MERKLKKRSLLTILIALMFIISAIGATMMFSHSKLRAKADDADVWDGDLIAAGWGSSGHGTLPLDDNDEPEYVVDYVSGESGKIDTVHIKSAAAFAYFAHEVYLSGINGELEGVTVELETDIDLDGHMWVPIGQVLRKTTGKLGYRFSGTFNGNNHKIIGLDASKYFSDVRYDNKNTDETSDDEFVAVYTRESDQQSVNIPMFKVSENEYTYGLFGVAENITIKNLTVDESTLSVKEIKVDGASKDLLPDNIGTILGHGLGVVKLDHCTVGSPTTTTIVKADTNQNGAYGGIVGRIYSNPNANENTLKNGDTALTNFDIRNCTNYADVEFTGTSDAKVAGILGYSTYSYKINIEGCVNYGNIKGSVYAAGILGYIQINIEGNDYCTLKNCDNYGNIVSELTSANVGGIANIYRNKITENLEVSGCNNYGNLAGYYYVGGIFGKMWWDSVPQNTKLLNNFNYGDVYLYGDGNNDALAGGYASIIRSKADGKTITVSGGNLGTVYGPKGKTGNNFASGEGNAKIDFLVAAGSVVDSTAVKLPNIKELPAPSITDEHVRYGEGVENGNFKYLDDSYKVIIGLADAVADTLEGTLEIPDGVEIGVAAFIGKTKITGVTFNGNVTKIGDFAFAGTGIKSLTLPANITLGNAAFGGINSLNYVTLPENVASIRLGERVFWRNETRRRC